MFFNSFEFAVFLWVVFSLYWLSWKSIGRQNLVLLLSSYFFYGWWDYRFVGLLAFSSCIDFYVGKLLHRSRSPRAKRYLLGVSLLTNLGLLGVFKYYNFFVDSFQAAFFSSGQTPDWLFIDIILPVGISFYTFQTLSYTIDIYRGKIVPTNDFIAFGAFVSFFPQLVAGPIERASQLLPQFGKERKFEFDKAVEGGQQILWGLFKKIVIADNCAVYVDQIFSNPSGYPASALLLGAFFFAFQIYGDFSGYSDVAIGTARLFGFELMKNFAFPYFSRDMAEFWRRWHISLSTWFRDYVYFPLGGSRGTMFAVVRNVAVVFLVSGLWHGANWTFVCWGILNAIYVLPLVISGRNRHHVDSIPARPSVMDLIKILFTFSLTLIGWIFFRAENVGAAFEYLSLLFSLSIFELPEMSGAKGALITLCLVVGFVAVEWWGRLSDYGIQRIGRYGWKIRWMIYYILVFCMLIFGSFESNPFIYFQF